MRFIEFCLRVNIAYGVKAPLQLDFPGHHLRGNRKAAAPGLFYTPLITATATVLGNLEERGLEEKLMPEGSVFLEEQRKPLLRG